MSISSIKNTDISVIVQGAISGKMTDPISLQLTRRCLTSIRAVLPGATIILSTWQDSETDGLDYDKLILNTDPGLILFPNSNIPNNVNRQIVSTKSGLQAANTKYVLKIRSDMLIYGKGFLIFFKKYKAFQEKILDQKVLTCTFFSRNPRKKRTPYCFHPSDWIFFGYRTDVLNIWNIPLMSDSCALLRKQDGKPSPIVPEQYIWTSFLKKNNVLGEKTSLEIFKENILLSEMLMANNVVVLSLEQLNMRFLKGNIANYHMPHCIYTFNDWKRLYNKFCLAKEPVNLIDLYKIKLFFVYGIRFYARYAVMKRSYCYHLLKKFVKKIISETYTKKVRRAKAACIRKIKQIIRVAKRSCH